MHRHINIGEDVYFGVGSNDTSGSGDDGATPLFAVRLGGDAAGAAPIFSGTPTLISHVDYSAGSYEIAIAATVGNGFGEGNTYLVFCTLLVDSQNPTGFKGSFTIAPIPAEVQNLSSGSAAISTPAELSVETTGTVISGDVTDTDQLDVTYHQIEDDAGTLDMYYQFDVGGNGVPSQAVLNGRVNSANDSLDVFAWNWGGSSWDQIGDLPGQGSTIDQEHVYNLFTTHVGTGANIGKVRIRFQNTGLTAADLFVDQIFVSYSVVFQSTGYALGAVWIDTINGSPGTTPFVHGVADNPVNNIADALTIAAAIGLTNFQIASGSSITFAATMDGLVLEGRSWTLALDGQSCSGTHIIGATVSGICTGAVQPHFFDCEIGIVTLPPSSFDRCALTGKLTMGAAGIFHFHNCHSHELSAVIDFGVSVADSTAHLADYSGLIEFQNMGRSGTDIVRIEGFGKYIIGSNCTGGTIEASGNFTETDNASGVVTVVDGARFEGSKVADHVWDETITEPSAGAPSATPSMRVLLSWLWMQFRNNFTFTKLTSTTAESKIRNNAGTILAKSSDSDDGTTSSTGKLGAP